MYRVGDLKDKEMDELLSKRPASANGEEVRACLRVCVSSFVVCVSFFFGGGG